MIKHQQQPNGVTCTSACIAMILDKPVSEVVAEFHDDYFSNKINAADYLRKNNVVFRELHQSEKLDWKLYITIVASLNTIGDLHHIIIDLRDGGLAVLDPNKGRKGIKYYIHWDDKPKNDLEIPLSTYIVDMEIAL